MSLTFSGPDTLPDPVPGGGRYYLTPMEQGSDPLQSVVELAACKGGKRLR
jgi:hypothetical protein